MTESERKAFGVLTELLDTLEPIPVTAASRVVGAGNSARVYAMNAWKKIAGRTLIR